MKTKYKLEELFNKFNVLDICIDSRKVKAGDAFFALKGGENDGNQFINDALNLGANLIITEVSLNKNKKIFYFDDVHTTLLEAIEIFYPKLPPYLIAVTGTNGKSSVVSYCRQLFALLGKNSASIGSLGIECSVSSVQEYFNSDEYQILNTQDLLTFRKILHKLAENDINFVAFEASSHGLHQGRLGNIKVQIAAFISFGHDHLDYHKTLDNYLAVKLKLFTNYLIPNSLAIINSEISQLDFIQDFLKNYPIKILTIGNKGEVKITQTMQSLEQQIVNFTFKSKNYNFITEIIGSYQASNLITAVLLVHNIEPNFDWIMEKLPLVTGVKGRLERVTSIEDPYQLFVDHAHKPAALENSLLELKKILHPLGKLIVIFGCGGNRDREKRGMMGMIATSHADIVIITDDNPRNEEPASIRREILKQAPGAMEITDRKEAINYAVKILKKGDILLIAGKGHEEYQIIKEVKIPFSDQVIAREAINIHKRASE